MNSQDGNIYAQQSFDYERFQVLQFTIRAEDAGSPKLSSNITVYLYILDENDNSPSILYPGTSIDVTAQHWMPKSLPTGSLVTKVTAVDADSGHNAWLSYAILKATDPSLFKITPHTGEIKMARIFQETDSPLQSLCIVVKDHGNPTLSSTATILFSLEESISKESHHPKEFLADTKERPNLTLYLVISLAAISIVSIVTFIILLTKCHKINNKMDESDCCFLKQSRPTQYLEHSQKTLQLNPNGTLKYLEVSVASADQQNRCYKTCYSAEVDRDTLNVMRSLNFPQLKDLVNESDDIGSGQTLRKEHVQVR
ncbi:hypothetical protein FKM82_011939 [Ascaphus truei]